MPADLQTFVNIIGTFLIAVLGWVSRQLWIDLKTDVKKVREDHKGLADKLHALEVDLPKTYTPKDDFAAAMKEINAGLQRIYDKLDGKADKT